MNKISRKQRDNASDVMTSTVPQDNKTKVLSKVFGDPQKRILRRLQKSVDEINSLAPKYAKMDDEKLREQTEVLKKRLAKIQHSNSLKEKVAQANAKKQSEKTISKEKVLNKNSDEVREKYAKAGSGSIEDSNALDAIRQKKSAQKRDKALDEILPDAFAVVREMATRVLGQRHFDVQLLGGIALHEGNVAEMKTGEGKTLVATAPVYLNALTGRGVHMVTVNDFLAQLHGGWMGSLYHALGMSTGVIINEQSFVFDPEFINENHFDKRMQHLKPVSRKEAYAADITYGTNNEFGFDYLRDNMVNDPNLLRQRELNFAIVDEVDSILID